jgi:hypothetical protein
MPNEFERRSLTDVQRWRKAAYEKWRAMSPVEWRQHEAELLKRAGLSHLRPLTPSEPRTGDLSNSRRAAG